MSDALNTYFHQSQFAMAAYANLSVGAINPSLLASPSVGFSDNLAADFAANYRVASIVPENLQSFGFYAVVFERLNEQGDGTGQFTLAVRGTDDISDTLIDIVDVALIGSADLNPQYDNLKQYVSLLTGENGLLASGTFDVTGHSLGGFLAQALAKENAQVAQAFTYNAPGFGGAIGSILTALGVQHPTQANSRITNLVAFDGISSIAGLGQHIGAVLDVFIPTGSLINNHSIATITDALSLYSLFERLDPTNLTLLDIGDIVRASSNQPERSLGTVLDAVRELFGPPSDPSFVSTPAFMSGDTDQANRNTYYANLNTLTTSLPSASFHVVDLTEDIPGGIVLQAQSADGMAFRYALRELNPFTLVGQSAAAAAIYASHNINGALDLVRVRNWGQRTISVLRMTIRT